MSNTKLLDLRPNRDLLNSEFDGYKLSLTKIDTITEEFDTQIDKLVPSEDQYSFLHAKLFLLQNYLYGENEEPEAVYFVDKSWSIQKYTIDPTTNTFEIETLWQIPLKRQRESGCYNVSMHLTTEKHAVVSDGMGFLYVLDRGSRQNSDEWQIAFCAEVLGSDKSFLIRDSVYKHAQKEELHLLLVSIQRNQETDRFSTILNWITLENLSGWNQTALRELKVDGFIQYANLERSCSAVYVVSDSGCKFTLDSEKEITVEEITDAKPIKTYTWTQTKDDITITFILPGSAEKDAIKVTTADPKTISVHHSENSLLDGEIYHIIDSNMTTWTLNNNRLEVTLQKSEVGLMWPELIPGNSNGEYVADPALVNEVSQRLAQFTTENETSSVIGTTFNSQQVEECDFECDKLSVFERIDCSSHKATHRINLGSHQVNLTVNLAREQSLAFGIRSDVDCCIWQPGFGADFNMEHVGTLLSLAYIQASKQQTKFFACSPDMGHTVICDNSHLFIYAQNKAIGSNELRNRRSGKMVSNLAQQQVHSLGPNQDIYGVWVSNRYIYILGEHFITALKL